MDDIKIDSWKSDDLEGQCCHLMHLLGNKESLRTNMDKYGISVLCFDRSDNDVGSIVANGIISLNFMSLDSIKKEEYSTLVKEGK